MVLIAALASAGVGIGRLILSRFEFAVFGNWENQRVIVNVRLRSIFSTAGTE
jgi:hypothetical protein